MFTIGLTFAFEAGHFLTGLPDTHKCTRQHGHNYLVEVEAKSDKLNAVGFVTDYFDLLPIKEWVDKNWDHRNLNDVVKFNPTVENLCHELFDIWKTKIPELSAITIRETPTTFARYEETPQSGSIT
jgi:6-pyruvoyltetrahydropterin/6-carboxytetrahydropterin synthase